MININNFQSILIPVIFPWSDLWTEKWYISFLRSTRLISRMNFADRNFFSQVPSYTLQVQATDRGVPELSSIVLVSIEVTDVNDNPPAFTQPSYSCVVQVTAKI